jgi:Fic family protein
VLSGTPYLLEGEHAAAVIRTATEFDQRIRLLRNQGTLDPGTLARLREEWHVEQVYETVGIEGNQLDLQETRLVLARGITISGKPARDSAEARNMKQALDFLEELARSDEPLRALDLRQIHQLIVGDEPGAGSYRRIEVQISGSTHIPPQAIEISRRVDEALDWLANAETCPALLAAAVIHAWIAHIHPFVDGNGRTARAIMNLVLVRRGYPIVLIRRRDRAVYYDALAASDDGDIAPLLELLLNRSGDSFRQIDRIRTAEIGVTEAVLRAQERATREYEAWRYAMLLLLAEIEREAQHAREISSGAIDLRVREYDQVTAEDYLALLERDPTGNGWLAVLRGSGPLGMRNEILLWVGFRSSELVTLSGARDRGASVFLSEPDPNRLHGPFRALPINNPFAIREISFDGDEYLARERVSGQERVSRYGAAALGAKVIADFISTYLNTEQADASTGS